MRSKGYHKYRPTFVNAWHGRAEAGMCVFTACIRNLDVSLRRNVHLRVPCKPPAKPQNAYI